MFDDRRHLIGWHMASALLLSALFFGAPVFAGCSKAAQDQNMITANQSANLKLDLPPAKNGDIRLLELTVKPVETRQDEKFLLTVKTKEGQDTQTLETLSFFPPPVTGKERTFLLDLSGLKTQPDVDLKLEIIPVVPGEALKASKIEITGSRWIGSTAPN